MINVIIELLTSLFDSFLCMFFITSFCLRKIKETKLFFPAVAVYFGATLFCDKYLSGFNMLGTLILFVISLVYAITISNKKVFRAILASCIFKAAFILLSSLLFTLVSFYVEDFGVLMQGSDYIGRYIYIILHKICVTAVLLLALTFAKKNEQIGIKSGVLSFIFTLITILGLGATMIFASVDNGKALTVPTLIIVASFVVINVFFYFMISQILKYQKTQYEIKRLEDQLKFEEESYQRANAIWSNIRKIQHDIKQHLTVIKGFSSEGDNDKCVEYIDNLLPTVSNMSTIVQSDNSILDFLINSKLSCLENTQIIVTGSIGDISDIEDSDLACLIGNILDNAIEAVANLNEKRIELLFMKQDSNRVIICKNTVSESVLNNNKLLKSTKKDKGSHGYGHLIIEQIAEKYHGMVNYFEEYDMFGVQVILPVID